MALEQEQEEITVSKAASRYLAQVPPDKRQATQQELNRFVRWCGPDSPIRRLTQHEIELYGQSLISPGYDPVAHAEIIRSFLAFARKEHLTPANLGIHLKVRRPTAGVAASTGPLPERITLTAEGHASIVEELEALKAQRPHIAKELEHARADKDFRENAPLDAARQQQAYLEGRIRELEAVLRHAEIVDNARPAHHAARTGSTVTLRNLASGQVHRYTLVAPAEVNPREGKISVASPVGQAILDREVGDDVEVAAPAGKLRFRIEDIEG